MHKLINKHTRNNIASKLFSVIISLSLILSNLGLSFQSVEAHQSVAKSSTKATMANDNPYSDDTCIVEDGTGNLTVDNSLGSGATYGCLIDYSSFPVVRVRVHNEHGFWTNIKVVYNFNNVSVNPINVWADSELIAPNGFAEYELAFDSDFNSFVQFFVYPGRLEDTLVSKASVFNVLSKIMAVFEIDLVNASLGDVGYIIEQFGNTVHLTLAADALSDSDLVTFLREMHEALGDNNEIKIISNIAQRFGVSISISAFKAIFTSLKIILTAKDIWEIIWSIATGSMAGGVTFQSQVQSDPPPPPPSPTPPPIPTPPPLPTSDQATFTGYETIPDGSVVSPGQALVKTWRVRNSGTSTWQGYKLKFVDGKRMDGPTEITIPTTVRGETVDLTINLTAPTAQGKHRGTWQIINRDGGWVRGGQLWISVNVQPQSSNITLSADPPSPASAGQVRIYARVDKFPNLRALRVVIDGDELCQLGAPEITDCVWHTHGYATGQHAIVAEADDWIGSSWDNPERKGIIYKLTGSGVVNHAPYRPILQSPYNWYLKDAAGAPAPVQMCVYPSSDPDGDPVSYWFELNNGAITRTSGWITSTCWEPTLDPGLYSWRVKAGDGSSESDWSQDTWNFSVAGGGVYIGDINLFAENTNETHMCVFVTHDGIQAPEVRAWINEATDGSESGEWRLLDHYGPNAPPDCTQSNYHGFWIRSPYYETGNHLIRINATKADSGASATKTTNYNIAYIAPPYPVTIAPATPDNNGTWWNTSAITFRWEEPLRAEGYQLRVSTSSDVWNDPTPLLDQSLSAGTTEYTHTFSQDYDQLYWSVRASNSAGASDSGSGVWFGIDHIKPTCTVQTLPTTTVETVFQVSWSGSDNAASVRSFDIQYLDTDRGEWSDWLTGVPGSRTFALFTGQPGHTYYFRCRATDNANNTGDYPDSADTSTTIDLTARLQTPWWDSSYSKKRNIVILNNMPDINLPGNYPIHLHFDSTTTPTAEELYNASQSNPKCDDLRIVFEDLIELHRLVKNCSTEAIDLWFISVEVLAGESDDETLQLYYGNPNPDPPLDDPNQVWRPYRESDTAYLYFFQEGSGATAFDSSGFARHCTIDPSVQWAESKFGNGLRFNRANYGDSHSLTCGSASLSSFTIEFWYKPDPDDGGRIAGQLGSGGQLNWLLQNFEGTIRLDTWECPTCGSQDVRSNFNLHHPPYVGNWNHIAVTFNGGNEVKFYINGTLDSTKYLQDSGINTYNVPLEIGSVGGISQVKANMGGFRISTGVKTSFYYGEFADITDEPTVMVGSPISQPSSGSPDLVVLSLTTYPNPNGGVLAQAVVQNQGELSTQNGFFTDVYVDHIPTGAGDYTGSISFWVNDPITATGTVTLTTVITDLVGLSGGNLLSLNATDEVSGTLYAQTDSLGVVSEPDDQNNIYSSGAEICIAAPDTYEGDDTYASTSNVLNLGASQSHNFHALADQDWLKIEASGGMTYTIRTSNLGVNADTYLYLYDTDGTTSLAANDDYGGTLASQIDWTAPATATYYLAVKHWNPNAGGCGTAYTISFNEQEKGGAVYLPIILKNSDGSASP